MRSAALGLTFGGITAYAAGHEEATLQSVDAHTASCTKVGKTAEQKVLDVVEDFLDYGFDIPDYDPFPIFFEAADTVEPTRWQHVGDIKLPPDSELPLAIDHWEDTNAMENAAQSVWEDMIEQDKNVIEWLEQNGITDPSAISRWADAFADSIEDAYEDRYFSDNANALDDFNLGDGKIDPEELDAEFKQDMTSAKFKVKFPIPFHLKMNAEHYLHHTNAWTALLGIENTAQSAVGTALSAVQLNIFEDKDSSDDLKDVKNLIDSRYFQKEN